jgi:hypothetical protein
MILSKYTWFIILIPLFIGIFYFSKLSKSHKFLFWFVVTGSITEITSRSLKMILQIKNNMPLGHLYITVSFIFIGLFFYHELKDFINKKILIWIIILYGIFSFMNVLLFQSHLSFPSITGATSALFLVTFSILLFANIMRKEQIKILSDSSLIWINTAVIVYYSGNFFLFILYNFLLDHSLGFLIKILNFFAIMNLIFYVLIAIGIFKAGKSSNFSERIR